MLMNFSSENYFQTLTIPTEKKKNIFDLDTILNGIPINFSKKISNAE